MIIRADARALPLRDGCVDCCVTSPPYFGLRDYGNSQQIGLEPTPDAFVASLVTVFREVKRVLKDSGTLWLNLGDSYGRQGGRISDQPRNWDGRDKDPGAMHSTRIASDWEGKAKDLIGIPWMVAFALRADGWFLRSDIIWSKPNPMPESVTDRPTKAHEYLFLLAKSERYHYDAAAIAEDSIYAGKIVSLGMKSLSRGQANGANVKASGNGLANSVTVTASRNRRSVWTVATEPYSGAHFATFPEKLIEPCILAGCPSGGLVLDPFLGSGTVGAVAERLGRRWVGTDLSYQHLAKKRTAQRGLKFSTEGA